MITPQLTLDCIHAAKKHLNNGADMQSSAFLSFDDADKLWFKGDYEHAFTRAMKSLAYSVGIMHADYKAQLIILNDNGEPPEAVKRFLTYMDTL